MGNVKVYKKLEWLNGLPVEEAEYVFTECSGSAAWARRMAVARPYPLLKQLYARAVAAWATLEPDERAAACPTGVSETEKLTRIERNLDALLER